MGNCSDNNATNFYPHYKLSGDFLELVSQCTIKNSTFIEVCGRWNGVLIGMSIQSTVGHLRTEVFHICTDGRKFKDTQLADACLHQLKLDRGEITNPTFTACDNSVDTRDLSDINVVREINDNGGDELQMILPLDISSRRRFRAEDDGVLYDGSTGED